MFNNFKRAIAIACMTVAVGTVSMPNFAHAQPDSLDQIEQMKPGQEMMKKLNLTEAQKTQLKAIRENAMKRRQAVLTPEQKAILEKNRKNSDYRGWVKELNLTADQKQKLQAIRQDSKKQVEAVLTAEQKKQLQAFREQRKENRNDRRNR
ncbi:MAG: hypothetical protein NW214_04935 [Pseudanabaenaceae cyanobacterium bins.39]|nr:hypothetical protein [Pseudanabaenaceae cyanobacterium bins.39]